MHFAAHPQRISVAVVFCPLVRQQSSVPPARDTCQDRIRHRADRRRRSGHARIVVTVTAASYLDVGLLPVCVPGKCGTGTESTSRVSAAAGRQRAGM